MKKVLPQFLLYVIWILPAVAGSFWWSLWFIFPLSVVVWIGYKRFTKTIDRGSNIVYFFYDFMSEKIPDTIPAKDVLVKGLQLSPLFLMSPVLILIVWVTEKVPEKLAETFKKIRKFLQSYEDFISPNH